MDSKTLKLELWNKAKEVRQYDHSTEGMVLAGLLEQAALRIENLAAFKEEVMERTGYKNYRV